MDDHNGSEHDMMLEDDDEEEERGEGSETE
jgi:hypothetical protein